MCLSLCLTVSDSAERHNGDHAQENASESGVEDEHEHQGAYDLQNVACQHGDVHLKMHSKTLFHQQQQNERTSNFFLV